MLSFYGEELLDLTQPPNWRTVPVSCQQLIIQHACSSDYLVHRNMRTSHALVTLTYSSW